MHAVIDISCHLKLKWKIIQKQKGKVAKKLECRVLMYVLWFNFILSLNFIFFWFLGMVMYDNEFETKEYKIQTKDKIEPQHMLSKRF